MEQKSNPFLETERIGALMRQYAVPCIISLVVAALYNIVDQIFIANAAYLGSYGNAANTVVFPLTVVALAIAVMIGDGACAFVSISLGAGNKENAHRSIGDAIVLCLGSSVILTAVYLLASEPILGFFGGKVNEETYECAKEYFFWIALGIPFYMFGQVMNPIIRSDGSPRFAMVSTVAGAVANIILDPIFIFPLKLGMMGAAVATVAGQILTAGLAAGCIPVVGYNIGAGRKDRAKGLFTLLLTWEAFVGLIALLIVELLPRQLIGIFGAGSESAYYTSFAIRCFRIYLCMMVLAMVNKGTFIYLQALGKAGLSMILSLVREIVFGVFLPILLPRLFGLDGVLYAFPAADVLTFLLTVVIVIQVYRELSAGDGERNTARPDLA